MKRNMKFSPVKLLSTGLVMLAALAAVTPQTQGLACTPPPAGIVGWWKGDGTAVDVVAGNNGVLVNVGYTNGVVGQAFACDPESFPYGTYTGVQIADQPAYALTNALTIEGWIRPRGDGYNIFWRGDNRRGTDPYYISMSGNHVLVFLIADQNNNYDTVNTTLDYGVWVHVAATYDSNPGTLSLYTNGVLAAQKSTTIRPFGNLIVGDSPGIGIGNVNDGFNNFPFTGDIDEIALYSRALTPPEIQAIYNAGSAGKCLPGTTACTPPAAGMVSWWPGNGSAQDIRSGNNGTWNGTGNINVYGSGMVSQALAFDGTHRDRVDVGNPANLQLQNLTIEAWVKRASATVASLDENFADGSIAGPGGYIFGYGAGGYGLVLFDDGSVGLTQNSVNDTHVPSVITDTNWHHVAVSKSGTAVDFYVDGIHQPTPSLSPYTNIFQFSSSAAIGSRGDGGGNTFFGLVDELAIYNRALTSNEVAAIFNAGSAGKCTGNTVVSEVPAIFNFSPTSGSNGTIVAIVGTNFSPAASANIVYFGAVRATVLSASPTSLTVTVPTGATYAPITVSVGGLIAYASKPFLVTFAGSGSTALAPRLDLPANDGVGQVVFADLDGDGKADLVVASGDHGISIYQNISTNGTVTAASFAPRVDLPVPAGLDAINVADVDGDGRLDILFLNRTSSQVVILKNISTTGLLTTNSFAAPVAFSTGTDPRGLAVQDLDGDGKPELIVANWGDNTVSVFHHTGAGGITTNSFAAATIFAVGANPQGLAVADLDGDGKPDVVTANNNYGTTNSVSILRNTSTTGNIAFAPSVGLAGLPTSYGIAVGDLDGDGKLDLAVSSFINGQAVSVYRNTSTPGTLTASSFAPNVDFSTGGWGNAVAIGDLDGDGKPDLAVVTQLPDHLSIFKNVSTPGSFTTSSLAARVDYPTGWNPNGVAIGDLDGDGRPDIAFAVSYAATLSIYQNHTTGTVTTPSTNPPVITAVAPKIGMPGTTILISGTNFSPVAASNIVYFGAVQAIVSSASLTSLTVTVPSGATFAPITVTVNGMTANSGQPFEPTFTGNDSSISGGSFAPSFNLGTGGGPGSSVIADLDGDGKPDIAFVSSDSHVVSIFRNISTNGTVLSAASFAPRVDLPFPSNGTSGNPYRLRAVDLDGDGKLDLIACEVSGNRVSVFHNVATPGTLTTNSFEASFALISGSDCRFAAAADLDADGLVDIVALNYGDKTISLFKNIGAVGSLTANSFAPPVVLAAPGGPYEAAIADLDGDGKPDLAVANSDSGTVSVYQNFTAPGVLATNSFAPRLEMACGSGTDTIIAADLDGDGKLDLVAGSAYSDSVSVFHNTHAGGSLTTNSFAPRVDFGTPGWMHTVAIADFNGDGKPDICVVGELSSFMSVFQNISTPGSFTTASLAPRVDFGTGWNAWGIAAGDLDGDGRPDIVFCNAYDANIQIYQNVVPFGTPTTCTPAPSGLAGWWQGEGNANDVVGGNNGILLGGAVYTNGEVGKAFELNGTDAAIKIPANSSLDVGKGNGMTVEGWINPSSVNLERPIVEWNNGSSYATHFWISTPAGGGAGCLYANLVDTNGNAYPFGSGGGFVVANVFQHVALTYDKLSGLATLYLNGTNIAQQHLGSINPKTSDDLYIGTRISGGAQANWWTGVIDEISLYNRALSANEIAAIYHAGSAGKCASYVGPVITTQPTNLTATVNGTAFFTVAASGTAPLIYQWNFNGTNLAGATNATLTINNVQPWQAGNYFVTVSNPVGAVVSSNAVLTVNSISPCTPAPAGIVAWWPAENNANDIIGTNNGISQPGVAFGPGRVGQAFLLNSSNAFVRVPASAAMKNLGGGNGLTIEAWINLVDVVGFHPIAEWNAGNGKLGALFWLGHNLGDNAYLYANLVDTNGFTHPLLSADGVVTANSFQHVALTYDPASGMGILYVNGTNVAQANLGSFTPQTSYDFWLGHHDDYAGSSLDGGFLGGLLDELSLYGRALSANEIAAIYHAGSAGKCSILEAPTITLQSVNQTVILGDPATFDITATGSHPLHYFWQRNGAFIPDATNSSYTLNNAQLADSGSKFSCLVTNAYGSATSSNATLKVLDTVANDLCSGAILITNASSTNLQSTLKASAFGDPVPDCVDGFGHGVWYQFTAPVGGLLVVDTFGSDFDTGLAIYTGACGSLTEVACNDDTGGVTSQVTLPTIAGMTYHILAGGYSSDAGNLVLHLNHLTPPAFAVQPMSQSVVVGSNASFSALVTGALPMSFQWSFNSTPLVDDGRISGSTTANLIVSNITTADAGSYTLTATNFLGTADSTAAVLTVLVPPSITTQPLGRSVPPGLPTTFDAAASGNPTPSYQWQLNGTNIPGATSSSYSVTAVGTNQLGFYHLVASNLVGTATSADAQLTYGPVAAWGFNTLGQCLPPPGLSNVISVAGGIGTSLAVRTDGTVVSWGSSVGTNVPASASNVVAVAASGQVGNYALRADGTVVSWAGPIPPALSNVFSVAVGFNFGMALRAEGTVVGWGNPPFAIVPAGLNHVTTIACGFSHSLALRSDGTVTAWGTGAITNVPARVTNVTAIAAGYAHSLALRSDGTVVAWGSGSGTNLPAGLTNVTAISTENSLPTSFSLALRGDGTVVTWGESPYGETNPPPALNNLLSVAIAAAPNHGLALVNDGSPVILHPPIGLTAYTGRDVTLQAAAAGAQPLSYQWLLNGTNVPGATNASLALANLQLSNAGSYQLFVSNFIGTAISLPAPVKVISNNTLFFLSQTAGGVTNYQGSKVTVGSVTVLGSGPLTYQWFFSTTNKNYISVPGATNDTLVLDPALAWQSGNYYVAVSNGFIQPNQTYALTSAPVNVKILFARAWGYYAVSNPPVNVTNAIAVATGGSSGSTYGHYLALGADGKVTAWGNLPSGFPVGGVSATNVSALSNVLVTAIAAGYQHSLALKSDGTVYAWGDGASGQTNPPSGLNSVVAIACGGYHDLALKSDGTVVGWGAGGTGLVTRQYDYGQTTNYPAATNVVAIAAGDLHSLALRADGTVVGWGYGGQSATTIPFNATNVVAIAAGNGSGAALRANGTVVQWGSGMGNYPTPPANLSNVVAISGSATHYSSLRNDGTVVSWGYEYNASASNNVPSDVANVAAIASGGDHDFGLFGTRAPKFTVQPWNRSLVATSSVIPVTTITLAGKCVGVQPMSYHWRLNGTNYPGATNDTLNVRYDVASFTLPPNGAFQLVASNAYGVTVSKPAKVTWSYSLGYALNAPGLNWTTSGNAPWYGETNITHDGVAAARSGGIGALQETILQTTLGTNQAGSYTFWWKVSSEQFFDTLEFRVNGSVQASISGEVDWQQVSIPVAAGTNVLQWRYSKDASFDAGLDAGFVDQFAFLSAPNITRQPSSLVNYQGTTAFFSVSASGVSPMTYQWRKNGTNLANTAHIAGVTTPSLVLSAIDYPDAGSYTVVITNLGGSVTSSPALLTVLDGRPVIVSSPVSLTNNAGTPATFAVTATGGSLIYQWQKNGVTLLDAGNVSGSATSLLTLTNVQRQDAGVYTVIITNNYGSLTSSPAMLTVIDVPPTITSQPVNCASLPGKTAAFAVTAAGTTPLSYQWQFAGTNIAGATNSTLALSNIARSNAGPYQVIVTNSVGATTSAVATLTVRRSMVVAWGDNTYGQTNVPSSLLDVKAISAGWRHNLALETNGQVAAWGYNGNCTVGVPPGLSNVVAVSAGGGWGLALKADGRVVGLECDGVDASTNWQVSSLSNITAVAAGWYHWLALKSDGSLVTYSVAGDSYTPTNLPAGLTNVTAIAGGSEYSVALKADGTVVAWGWNDYGQTNVPLGLSNVIAIAASATSAHTLALKNDGTVSAWGADWSGQSEVPAGLSNVVAIAAGQQHSLALKADGTVMAWGTNVTYTVDPGMAKVPPGLSNVIAIAAAELHSAALINDGSPVILRQPASQTVGSNTTVHFSVTALGAPALTYQWKKDGVSLDDGGKVSGAATASLTVSNVESSDMAIYTVVIANAIDHVTSSPAALVIVGPPAITAQPVSQTVNLGSIVQFSVEAIGFPTPTYQWWWNGTNQVGGNSPLLVLNNVAPAQAGTYSVNVANSAGTVVSINAVLTVFSPQRLGTPTLLPNGTLQLTSADAGGGTLLPSDLPRFEAQASTDLVNWVTLPNALSLTNGMLLLQDNSRTNYTTRYYRIIEH